MSLMVPAPASGRPTLDGVARDLLDALVENERSQLLIIVDGLGAGDLRAHAAYARSLSSRMTKRDVALSVFPTTTAAALTSIMTASPPGQHGLVGYEVRDPTSGRIVNQLAGWERSGIDAQSWQRESTIFERAREAGFEAHVVHLPKYAASSFTGATLRGAVFEGVKDVRERVLRAGQLASGARPGLVVCYVPELDKAGHGNGVASPEWLNALEEIDAALARMRVTGADVTVTADHGMINVPERRHVLLESGDPRLQGVAAIAGEPRLLHIYLEPGTGTEAYVASWRELSGEQADIGSRDEWIAAGHFGEMHEDVRPRVGDVLVAARGNWAFYDARRRDGAGRGMIGQHGSLTPEETRVPLIRW